MTWDSKHKYRILVLREIYKTFVGSFLFPVIKYWKLRRIIKRKRVRGTNCVATERNLLEILAIDTCSTRTNFFREGLHQGHPTDLGSLGSTFAQRFEGPKFLRSWCQYPDIESCPHTQPRPNRLHRDINIWGARSFGDREDWTWEHARERGARERRDIRGHERPWSGEFADSTVIGRRFLSSIFKSRLYAYSNDVNRHSLVGDVINLDEHQAMKISSSISEIENTILGSENQLIVLWRFYLFIYILFIFVFTRFTYIFVIRIIIIYVDLIHCTPKIRPSK